MTQALSKRTLMELAHQVEDNDCLDAALVEPFLSHEFQELSPFSKFMLRLAAWISLFFASVLVIFPEVGEYLISVLPGFFLLPERLAKALDYVWGLVGKPVGKQHLMYHLPNIIIYAFGVAGIRQLWRKVNKNNWKDRVKAAQTRLGEMIDKGTGRFTFKPGFSLLFVGGGDQIGKSLVLDDPTIGPTMSTKPPAYTRLWARYKASDGDEAFERVIEQFNSEDAGEYVLFPVVDDQLFLPGPLDYDMPPHRVEIAVRRIREFEKERGWRTKRIIIVGDRVQNSRFVTSSRNGQVEDQIDDVSLATIAEEYENVIVADPTDITLRRIIEVADGRQILFRASEHGAEKYSEAFYRRLADLGYEPTKEATLTVGYDISDLETEHQVVSQRNAEYMPVILSREVFDLLSSRYLREGTFVFVPRLVKEELQKLVA